MPIEHRLIKPARAFTWEGVENSGKTTFLNLLAECLKLMGVAELEIPLTPGMQFPTDISRDTPILLRVREPGGTVPGCEIRSILLDKDYSKDLGAIAHALGFTLDRAILYPIVREFLKEFPNGIVFGDRCDWSTEALQFDDAERGGENSGSLGLIEGIRKIFGNSQLGISRELRYPQRMFF